ncbi:MAG: hypothetical protein ACRDMJ_01805 [Solirubrobacteraceae bacterium]
MVLAEEQPQPVTPPPSDAPPSFARRYAWWIVGIALVAFSAGVVRWAGTRPGYDPYGWMVWGWQTIHLSLNLGGAPSWKPMTWLFNVPYAVFGHYDLWLWMTTAVALSFAGCIWAGRIAFRIIDRGGRHRWPAIIAALFAAACILGIQDNQNYSYLHYILSAQSDPPLASLCLAAIDLAMIRRYGWSLAALTLAALGRPESWPFLLVFLIWAWREHRELVPWIVGVGVLLIVLWFGIPTITNGRPLLAAQLAEHSPRMTHGSAILGTIGRFRYLNLWPVWAGAGIGAAWAAYRRSRIVLGLFAVVVIWMVVEVAFSMHGFPGQPRYMFEPAVVSVVIAAVAIGWLLTEIPRDLRVPRWAGVGAAVALMALLVPGGLARARREHKELQGERARTHEIDRLAGFVNVLGRDQLLACGEPVVGVEYVSALAWMIHVNTGTIGYRPQVELHKAKPTVLLTPLTNGWAAYPWHTKPAMRATCDARMKALYVFTPHHPNGAVSVNDVPPKLEPLHKKHK